MHPLTNKALRVTAYLLLHVGLLCAAVATLFEPAFRVGMAIGITLTTIAAMLFVVTRRFLPSEITSIVGLTQALVSVGLVCSSSHAQLNAQGMTHIAIISSGAAVAALAGAMAGVSLRRR